MTRVQTVALPIGVPYDPPAPPEAPLLMCWASPAPTEGPAPRRPHAPPRAPPPCGPRAGPGDAAGAGRPPRAAAARGRGPRARLVDGAGADVPLGVARDAVHGAALALAAGRIVAVKGIGGYHLACRADDEAAVATLRARKRREDKPFALMAPDVTAVRRL